MRATQTGILWQWIGALVLSAVVSVVLRIAGTTAMTIALFILLALLFSMLLAVVRARLTRPRRWIRRTGWGRNRGNGWDWTGVREPRRPYPPFMPPRAEAIDPEHAEPTR